MINVVVVDDSETIREGLKTLINSTEGYSCVGLYADCNSMLCDIRKLSPDVLLVDLMLPGMQCIEGIKEAKIVFPELTILVLTVYEENDLIFDALCAGASGYLVKKTPPKRLIQRIDDAFHGRVPMSSSIALKTIKFFGQKNYSARFGEADVLTQCEKEILNKLMDGNNFKAIADSLELNIETVQVSLKSIYKKLHVLSKSEANEKKIKEHLY